MYFLAKLFGCLQKTNKVIVSDFLIFIFRFSILMYIMCIDMILILQECIYFCFVFYSSWSANVEDNVDMENIILKFLQGM